MTIPNPIAVISSLVRPAPSPLFPSARQKTVINHLRAEVGAKPVPMTVHLDTLHTNPFQIRQRFFDLDIQELSESLRVRGLFHPVIIGDHDCRPGPIIICGEQRVRAARQLGWTTIPALHFGQVSSEGLIALAFEKNLSRVDRCPFDVAAAFKEFLDQGGTMTSLSAICGRAPDTIRRYLALLALPEVVINNAIPAKLSFRELRFVASLSSVTDQLTAIHRFVEDGHLPKTKTPRHNIKNNRRKERRDSQSGSSPDLTPAQLKMDVTVTRRGRPATGFSFNIECTEKSFEPFELRLALLQVIGGTYGDTPSPQEITRRLAADLIPVGVTT